MDNEKGFYGTFLTEYSASQIIHDNINSINARSTQKPVIFDIDLDLFNKSDMWAEGNLWEKDEIIEFIRNCSGIIKSSTVITVAMSFGYSGTEEDTKYLTKLFTTTLETQDYANIMA